MAVKFSWRITFKSRPYIDMYCQIIQQRVVARAQRVLIFKESLKLYITEFLHRCCGRFVVQLISLKSSFLVIFCLAAFTT